MESSYVPLREAHQSQVVVELVRGRELYHELPALCRYAELGKRGDVESVTTSRH